MCGVQIPKTPENLKLVRKELRVAPITPQDPYPKTFDVYVELPTSILVPKQWARKACPGSVGDSQIGTHACWPFMGSLRGELCQPQAVKAVQEAWRTTGGAMLCLPVGFGKTTCALFLLSNLGAKTAIVVHKEFLMRQWQDRIAQHLPDAIVSKVQGGVCDVSGDIVLVMIQTLVSRKYPPHTFAACKLVIVDEVHHIGAACFSSAMFSLSNAAYTLGLTATPDRQDRLDRVVTWFMGDVAFRLERQNQTSTSVKICKYDTDRYRHDPPNNRRGDICFTSIMSELVNDDIRTKLVADHACALAATGAHVLVLSHRRAHCARIAEECQKKGIQCETYMGGTGTNTVPDTQVIVATYQLTSEGFDCPRLTALVLATPAADVRQSCGRVMRGSSTGQATIVDIVDQWSVCHSMHRKRRLYYERSGFLMNRETSTSTGYSFLSG